MPETEAEANKDLEMLQLFQPPPPRVELKDIPKWLYDEHGNKSMNVRWVREMVRVQKEDRQAAHKAAALPMNALSKDTESLETTFKKTFQTRCTAKNKSKFCRGYCNADRLMPRHTKDANGQAIGIEDRCDHCYNFNEDTNHGEEQYNAKAKKVRCRRFNRMEKLKCVDEMKKFDWSDDITLVTNFPTVEFQWLDDRSGGLAVKLSRAAHITFRMNFSKIGVRDWSNMCHRTPMRGTSANICNEKR